MVTAVVMPPATTSPSKIAGRAVRRRMSSRDATSAPVQAPVPGRGMATRTNSPARRYFRTMRPFRWARRSSQTIFGPKNRVSRSQLNTRRVSSMINGTGNRFPKIAITQATAGGSPAAMPTGMAPRSSMTGTMAVAKVISNFPNAVSKKGMAASKAGYTGRGVRPRPVTY